MSSSQETATAVATLSVRALEDVASLILSNNFDADSRVCLLTLMKMIDNVLQKPNEPKVRTIRTSNKAFHNKIGQRRGGVEFFRACGFALQMQPPAIGHPHEQLLVLSPVNEKQSHLLAARRLLHTRAVQDLQMKAEDLPALKAPAAAPPPNSMAGSAAAASSSNSNAFNVYAGHRYDAQSASSA